MIRKIPAAIAVAVEFVVFSTFIVPAIDFHNLGGFIQAIILCVAMGVMSATWKTIAGTWQKDETAGTDNPAGADEPASADEPTPAEPAPDEPKPDKSVPNAISVKIIIGAIIIIVLLIVSLSTSFISLLRLKEINNRGMSYEESSERAVLKDVCTATVGIPAQSKRPQAQPAPARKPSSRYRDPSEMSLEEIEAELAQLKSGAHRAAKPLSRDFANMSNEELMRIASSGKPKQQTQNNNRPNGANVERYMMETFLNGASLRDAINLHGDGPDPLLANYDPPKSALLLVSAKRQNTEYATDVLIRYAELAGFSVGDIEQAKAHSGGDPYKMYDFLQGLAEKHLAK